MITIEHTHEDGTVVHGTARDDGTNLVIKATGDGWRFSRNIASWYLPRSRDQRVNRARIERLADALRTAGHDVEVTIDDARRDVADVEADRAERAAGRVERYSELADARHESGSTRLNHVRERRSHIPMGQPIVSVRDANYRNRLNRSEDSARKELAKGDHYANRAEAAESTQRYRESPRVTTRRIERLAAEQRKWQRELDEALDVAASPAWIERARDEIARLGDEIAHWRGQLDAMEASGTYRAWTREHFRKGDEVLILRTWYPVVRVNQKSVSVTPLALMGQPGSWTDTAPYDNVYGRRRDGVEISFPPAPE